jgi:hopene-associated glycosyltransferase HpnB
MTANILGAACLAIWSYLLLARGRFWLVREAQPLQSAGRQPKRVAAIIPARNEAPVVGNTIRSVLSQDYSGPLQVFLIDDDSSDDTVAAAQQAAATSPNADQLTVIRAGPRPEGWTGKLWAVSEGLRRAAAFAPDYYLMTDADIVHEASSLTQLVTRAETGRHDLVSLMVELRCQSFAEQALVPAFVFFFFMLYPPEWVQQGKRRTAAAAGGCVLISSTALANMGGIAVIRGELIDDCALARAIKQSGGNVWLGSTRKSRSIREYPGWSEIGQMISRSAFTQLRHSALLLALTCLGMFLTFILPVLLLFRAGTPAVLGITSWFLMSLAFWPTLRLYRCSPLYAPLLPVVALFYLGATVHSAIQYWRGKGGLWKERVQDPDLPATL